MQAKARQASGQASATQETVLDKAKKAFGSASAEADATANKAQREGQSTWQKVRLSRLHQL